ncbi:MAG: hypothetical protein AABW65_00670 [Nanoarchaeota archaeon]
MYWKNWLAGIMGVASLSFGCVHYPYYKNTRDTKELPVDVLSDFNHNYYRKEFVFESERKEIKRDSNYFVERIKLPESFPLDNLQYSQVSFDYYTPLQRNGKKPVMIILPIMGGENYPIEENFARYFTKKGYLCSLVHRKSLKDEIKRIEDIDGVLKQSVSDNKRVVDWLTNQKEVDENKIGVLGISFGAMKGALFLPFEKRVKAAYLGLCGGDIPYILAHTTEKGLARERDKRLEKRRVSLEGGENFLRENIKFDPLEYAQYVDSEKVFLVLASKDKIVPYEKGLELREAMGSPETDVYFAGHYSSLIYLPFIKRRAFDFFEKKFGEK